MKTKLSLALIALCFVTTSSFGQFSFGVSPGIGFCSGYFGYKINKFVPYAGFQYLNAQIKSLESGQRFDWDLNQVVSYSDELQLSGGLYIPNIGVKYFFLQKNKLQAYLALSVAKPMISAKMVLNDEVNEAIKDAIKDLSMWGGELGFGTEYFFDDNFSIGGEFGLRYFHLGNHNITEEEIYNPNTEEYLPVEIESDYKFNSSPTFTRITLNYYF